MIRQATLQDASRLAEILIFAKRCAYRSIFQNDAVSFGEMQVLPLALAYRDQAGRLERLQVFDDGIVKGMVQSDWEGASILAVRELYVDPFFQGQGIGRALLQQVEADGRAAHVQSIHLWVLEKNTAARGFYERQGFGPTGQRKLEEGTTEYLLQYEKSI